MKFLLLTQYFVPEIGASQSRLSALARELMRLGHDVEVVTALANYPKGKIFSEYSGCVYRREDWQGARIHRVWLYASQGAGIQRMIGYASFAVMSLLAMTRARKPDWIF